jgi:hypothetical protein
LDEVTFRQRHLAGNPCPDFIDHRSKVAVRHVRLHDDATLNVLAIDCIGSLINADFRHLADGNFRSYRRVDQRRGDGLDGLPGSIVKSDHQVIRSLILEHL